jgi:hypothetical protein
MRRSRRRRAAIALSGLFALLCMATRGTPQEKAQSAVHEAVNVREVEVLFDHPTGLRWMGSRFTPDRLQVTEGGDPRTVTRVEPMLQEDSEQPAMRIVIYVDRELADRDAVNQAIGMLTKNVERLTRLGEVEIVEADPRPRETLAATRDPQVLRAALLDAVRLGDESTPVKEAGTPEFEHQMDRFVNTLTGQRSGQPGLALWVTQTWPLPDLTRVWGMQGASALRSEDSSGAGRDASRLADLARLLAAEHWAVGVVNPSPEAAGAKTKTPPLATVESTPVPGTGGSRKIVLWNVNHLLAKILGWKTSPYNPEAAAEAAQQRLDPQLAPMQLVAAATAGRLVQSEIQIKDFLDTLDNRWHLFFAAPPDERTMPVPVNVGIVEDGIEFTLRQTWSAALEPMSKTRARLRQVLLDGPEALPADLAGIRCGIDVRPHKEAVDVSCQTAPGLTVQTKPLRLSLAAEGCESEEAVQVHRIDAAASRRNARAEFTLPSCAKRLAVAIEDPAAAEGIYWAASAEETAVVVPAAS